MSLSVQAQEDERELNAVAYSSTFCSINYLNHWPDQSKSIVSLSVW